MSVRVCPYRECAALNRVDAIDCVECRRSLVPRTMRPKPKPKTVTKPHTRATAAAAPRPPAKPKKKRAYRPRLRCRYCGCVTYRAEPVCGSHVELAQIDAESAREAGLHATLFKEAARTS